MPTFSPQERAAAHSLVTTALAEDLAYGPDATTQATVPQHSQLTARVTSRQHGVLAGVEIIDMVLAEVIEHNEYSLTLHFADGDTLAPGDTIATIEAPTHGLLTAERTFLNILCHLCAVSTATRTWVDAITGTNTAIRDTRKTLPGFRLLHKYAVRAGGGVNHRMGLGDAILIKDNHVVAAGSITKALDAVRAHSPQLPLEVEVDTLEQLDEMLHAEVDLILLDNFPIWQTQIAVQHRDSIRPRTRLESSGGITLDKAASYAQTNVDYLAIGALTHSVTVFDCGLDM